MPRNNRGEGAGSGNVVVATGCAVAAGVALFGLWKWNQNRQQEAETDAMFDDDACATTKAAVEEMERAPVYTVFEKDLLNRKKTAAANSGATSNIKDLGAGASWGSTMARDGKPTHHRVEVEGNLALEEDWAGGDDDGWETEDDHDPLGIEGISTDEELEEEAAIVFEGELRHKWKELIKHRSTKLSSGQRPTPEEDEELERVCRELDEMREWREEKLRRYGGAPSNSSGSPHMPGARHGHAFRAGVLGDEGGEDDEMWGEGNWLDEEDDWDDEGSGLYGGDQPTEEERKQMMQMFMRAMGSPDYGDEEEGHQQEQEPSASVGAKDRHGGRNKKYTRHQTSPRVEEISSDDDDGEEGEPGQRVGNKEKKGRATAGGSASGPQRDAALEILQHYEAQHIENIRKRNMKASSAHGATAKAEPQEDELSGDSGFATEDEDDEEEAIHFQPSSKQSKADKQLKPTATNQPVPTAGTKKKFAKKNGTKSKVVEL